jgi:putative DNA primase/helicase
MHRFPGKGKPNNNTSVWCILFEDGMAGTFGDWSTGLSIDWQFERDKSLSYEDRLAFKRHAEKTRVQVESSVKNLHLMRDEKQDQEYADAKAKALSIWKQSVLATNQEYLSRKNINPFVLRALKPSTLIAPLTDGHSLHSIQFIYSNGVKRFLKGGKTKGMFCFIKAADLTIDYPEKLLICEGFATGATLYMETNTPVVVTLSSSNLITVGKIIRKKHPKAELLFCGDNDHATEGNPGKNAAIRAAQACTGSWIVPSFTDLDPTPKDTDFNDLSRLQRAAR